MKDPFATPVSVSCRSRCRALAQRASTIFSLILLVAGILGASSLATASADDPVSFAEDVWPILEASCVSCHGTKERFANLRLDSPEAILKGGDLGKVLVPGDPDESSLYVRTSLPDDDLDLMPVEGERLDEEQQDVLKRWIAQGASFGDWTGN